MTSETPVIFACDGIDLIGVLHEPDRPGRIGVVVVVGGPQYRVGSHRQFVLLARHLAQHGHAVLRFDCRGMGDSGGEFPGFEHISGDIAAAIDTLWSRVPGLCGVVLWGLCDAASASLMYAPVDPRVAGLVLLNPWVRSEATLARTYLRSYYLRRLLSRDFWRKTLSGRLAPGAVLGDLAHNVRTGTTPANALDAADFVARMLESLRRYAGPVLIILSGNDITAAEFRGVSAAPQWRSALARSGVARHEINGANHTFSTAAWRDEVEERTVAFLERLGADATMPSASAGSESGPHVTL